MQTSKKLTPWHKSAEYVIKYEWGEYYVQLELRVQSASAVDRITEKNHGKKNHHCLK